MPSACSGDTPMAAGTPDLALRDLRVDGSQARPRPCEARDILALDPDMVELQDEWVALATVSAAVPREHCFEMQKVASDLRGPMRALYQLVAVRATPWTSPGGPSTMAVGANHFTLRDLRIDDGERRRCADQRCYRRGLASEVVELQNDRIVLATIHARVLAQEIQDVRSQPALTRLLGRLRLIAMELPARSEVRSEARPAPPLEPFPEAVEELHGQIVTTAAAVSELTGAPDAKPSDGHRAGRSRGCRRRRRGRDDVAYPHADRRLCDAELARNPPD
jgi:hypothetical protein